MIHLDRILKSAGDGLELAHEILSDLQLHESVALDFSQTEFITPSFTNALVLTLVHALGTDVFKERVCLSGVSSSVRSSLDRSVQRYERGIRLSSQHAVSA